MVNAYDVPASKLIVALTERVKKLPELEVPEWAHYAKTGSHAERPPQQPDWWYVRAASLLRKLYFRGPLGLTEFETAYGGRKAVRENTLRTALTTEARQRLANVKMVRPELATAIEEYVIQLASAGRLKKVIDDEQLKQMLYALQEKKRDIKIRRM